MKSKKTLLLATMIASAMTLPAFADSEGTHDMDMNNGMMMGGPQGRMGMMQQKQMMMKQHMQTMEQRLGNIEALLKELVELQKKK